MKRAHHLHLGPSMPIVPVTHFSKMRLPEEQWEGVWQIVGPSVERNFNKVPLWKLLCAAYVEGLSHGVALQAERVFPVGAMFL